MHAGLESVIILFFSGQEQEGTPEVVMLKIIYSKLHWHFNESLSLIVFGVMYFPIQDVHLVFAPFP